MALINCSECNSEISNKATACPKCGCPLEPIVKTYNSPLMDELDRLKGQAQPQIVQSKASNGVAAVLSFFIPGAGQIYKGYIFSGLGWLVFTVMGYMMFVFPGLILHLFCIMFAYDDPENKSSMVVTSQNDGC